MRHLRCYIGLTLAALLMLSGVYVSAADKTYEIFGTVTYPDGKPTAGVHLSIYANCKIVDATTDSNGCYRVSFEGDRAWVQAVQGDYVLAEYVGVPENTQGSVRKDLKFEYACLLLGEVTDISTGTPIEGARVCVNSSYLGKATSSADGVFKMRVPSRGELMMTVEKDGYVTKRIKFSTQDLTTSAWRIQLKPGGTIRGRVIDQNGQPVGGVEITIAEDGTWVSHVKADQNGNYEIKNVDPDRLAEISVPETQGATRSKTVKATFPSGSTETTADLTVTRIITRTITGKVTNESGNPITGAEVYYGRDICMNNAKHTKTNANGEYMLNGIAPGRDMVHAQADGFAPVFMPVSEEGDQQIDMKLGKAHSAGIQVVDPSGTPIPGAIITVSARTPVLGRLSEYSFADKDIYRWLYTTNADENGRATLKNLPADGTVIDLSASGYTWLSYVSIRADSADNIVKMRTVPQIAGSVVDSETGAPIQLFTVKWQFPGGFYPSGEPNMVFNRPDGKFAVGVDGGGKFAVKILAKGYIGEEKILETTATPDANCPNVFKLRKTRPITGRITDTSGKPMAGAKVTVVESHGVNPHIMPSIIQKDAIRQTAITAPDGSFSIDSILEEIAVVIVEKEGYPQMMDEHVDLTKPVNMSLIIPAALAIKAADMVDDNATVNLTLVRNYCYSDLLSKQLPKDGQVTFSDLEPADYIVILRGKERTEMRSITLKSSQKCTIDLDKKRPVIVMGTVTESGKPVLGVKVSIQRGTNVYSSSSVSDSQGRFTIGVEQPGLAELQQSQLKNGQMVGYVTQFVDLKPGENNINLKVPLGSISGRVIEAKTGQPVEGQTVEAWSKWGTYLLRNYDQPYVGGGGWGKWTSSTRTAKDGTFKLEKVTSCPVVLTILDGRHTQYVSSPINVTEKEPVNGVEIKLPEFGMLSVATVDSKTGKPVNARIYLSTHDGAEIITDNRYSESTTVPAGRYVMWAEPDNKHLPACAEIEVKPGKTAKITMKIKPAEQRIVFRVAKGGRLEKLKWPDKDPKSAKPIILPDSSIHEDLFKHRPWIGYEIRDAATGKPVIQQRSNPEWGGYLSDFDAKRQVYLPIKPGVYILDAVLRNTEDYSVNSKANLWTFHRKITVAPGKNTVIELK